MEIIIFFNLERIPFHLQQIKIDQGKFGLIPKKSTFFFIHVCWSALYIEIDTHPSPTPTFQNKQHLKRTHHLQKHSQTNIYK